MSCEKVQENGFSAGLGRHSTDYRAGVEWCRCRPSSLIDMVSMVGGWVAPIWGQVDAGYSGTR